MIALVELADTPAARERGLMDRRELAPDGMLFLFDGPTQAPFWNLRTFLPLDLLFLDREGRIVDRKAMQTIVETNGQPVQYTSRVPYVAALEIVRGRAAPGVVRITSMPGQREGAWIIPIYFHDRF